MCWAVWIGAASALYTQHALSLVLLYSSSFSPAVHLTKLPDAERALERDERASKQLGDEGERGPKIFIKIYEIDPTRSARALVIIYGN